MALTWPLRANFSRGELTPKLHARADVEHYLAGLAECKNFMVMRQGGLRRRPGTVWMRQAKTAAKPRLVPFVFSTEQAYILEMGAGYVRFHTTVGIIATTAATITAVARTFPAQVTTAAAHGLANGARVILTGIAGTVELNNREYEITNVTSNSFMLRDPITAADIDARTWTAYTSGGTVSVPVELATPYAQDDLADIDYAQSADVLTLVHRKHQPRELVRLSETSWELKLVDFLDGPWLPPAKSLRGAVTPSDRGMIGPITASSTSLSTPANVLDGAVSTSALSTDTTGSITFTLGSNQTCDAYFMQAPSAPVTDPNENRRAATWMPASWAFEGRQTDNTWTILDRQEGMTWTGGQTRYYKTPNEDAYNAYRISWTGVYSGGNTCIAEVGLHRSPADPAYPLINMRFNAQALTDSGGWLRGRDENRALRLKDRGGQWNWWRMGASLTFLPNVTAITNNSTPTVTTQTAHGLTTGAYVRLSGLPSGWTDLNDRLFTITLVSATQFRLNGLDATGRPAFSGTAQAYNPTTAAGKLYGHALKDLSAIGEWRWGAWYTGNWPSTVTYYQQRRVFGGTDLEPQTVWFTKSADYYDFGDNDPPQDDDGITLTIVSSQINGVRWLLEGKELEIGTAAGIRTIGPNGNDPFSGTSLDQGLRTSNGSAKIKPVKAGGTTIYVDYYGKKLREFVYDFQIDGFLSPEVTVMADHLFTDGIAGMAYQQEPDSTIWVYTDTGGLVSFTYDREQKIVGLTNCPVEGGLVRGMTSIPTTSGTEVWMVVERDSVFHLEKLAPIRETYSHINDGVFLDGAIVHSGSQIAVVSGLWHLNGKTVKALADGMVYENIVVANGRAVLPVLATRVTVGLPFVSSLKTLRLPSSSDGSLFGRRAMTPTVILDVLDTLAVQAKSGGQWYEVFRRDHTDIDGQQMTLRTGAFPVGVDPDWTNDGVVQLKCDDPLPCTIRALVIGAESEP
jgi:hypothetical protein